MEKLILLYDAHCNLCVNSVKTLQRLPSRATLEFIPLQEAELPKLLPQASIEQLQSELHVIDENGEVFKGADAIISIVRTVRSLSWLASLYRVPLFRPVAQVMYRWIAKHRYQLFGKQEDCNSGSCEIHRDK